MHIIAEQCYYKIRREIDISGQRTVKELRTMQLYKDRIETRHRRFELREVLDVSFRRMGGDAGGFLYLHTSRGVFSYPVDSEPSLFIAAYKGISE
ncbi:hypothetical protein [Paenibacillus sp. GCM10027626]|uniref:hypothetical protein n=1 Tax=Paenibacillus sp. GCM10027626 TaxID=3273411 RepID=UPI00362FF04E